MENFNMMIILAVLVLLIVALTKSSLGGEVEHFNKRPKFSWSSCKAPNAWTEGNCTRKKYWDKKKSKYITRNVCDLVCAPVRAECPEQQECEECEECPEQQECPEQRECPKQQPCPKQRDCPKQQPCPKQRDCPKCPDDDDDNDFKPSSPPPKGEKSPSQKKPGDIPSYTRIENNFQGANSHFYPPNYEGPRFPKDAKIEPKILPTGNDPVDILKQAKQVCDNIDDCKAFFIKTQKTKPYYKAWWTWNSQPNQKNSSQKNDFTFYSKNAQSPQKQPEPSNAMADIRLYHRKTAANLQMYATPEFNIPTLDLSKNYTEATVKGNALTGVVCKDPAQIAIKKLQKEKGYKDENCIELKRGTTSDLQDIDNEVNFMTVMKRDRSMNPGYIELSSPESDGSPDTVNVVRATHMDWADRDGSHVTVIPRKGKKPDVRIYSEPNYRGTQTKMNRMYNFLKHKPRSMRVLKSGSVTINRR